MLRKMTALLATTALAALGLVGLTAAPAAAAAAAVETEQELRDAFGDADVTSIVLHNNIDLTDCVEGEVYRDSVNDVVLDGAGHTIEQTCDNQRILSLEGESTLTLQNVTLTGGFASGNGGAVITDGGVVVTDTTLTGNEASGHAGAIRADGSVTLTNATVTNNESGSNGGAINALGDVTITASTFTGNIADNRAGAVHAGGDVTIINSTLNDNHGHGGDGGAVRAQADVSVTGSHLIGNTAQGRGGAIYANTGDVAITESTLSGNRAEGSGGAIRGHGVNVIDSTLHGNTSDERGGAIIAQDRPDGVVTVSGSTLSGNHAEESGGAIWARVAVVLTNSTVTGNSAGVHGGAIDLGTGTGPLADDAVIVLRHSTLVGNEAPEGASLTAHPDLDGDVAAFGSVIIGPVGGDNCVFGGDMDVQSEGHNVSDDDSCALTDPTDTETGADLQLGALADNGGLTDTMLPAAGSLLIDAIPAGDCHPEVGTDQRGVERPQGEGCDIGAVEVTAADHAPDPGTDPTDPVADDSLADTGSRIALVLATAALLLAAGAGLVIAGRRRRALT